MIYRNSSPDVFSKKGVLLQIFSICTEQYPCQKDFNKVEVMLLHGCSPVNWLSICSTPFLKNTLGDCFCIYGSEYNRCLTAFACSNLKKNYNPRQNL